MSNINASHRETHFSLVIKKQPRKYTYLMDKCFSRWDTIYIVRKGWKNLTEQKSSTTTKKKIGQVTYVIVSAASPEAKDTMVQKIQKSIKRDMEKTEENI